VFVGPREDIEFLQRYVASQTQYLVVKHRDGRKENLPGPCEIFLNTLELESIAVRNAIPLDANHLLVVYKQEEGHIERRIIQGPTIFVPNAFEWYEFLRHYFIVHAHCTLSFICTLSIFSVILSHCIPPFPHTHSHACN